MTTLSGGGKTVDIENELLPNWPIPLPGVMSAFLVSMDDKYVYVNNQLHGDMRQYDITDTQPRAYGPGLDRRPAREGPSGEWCRSCRRATDVPTLT